MLQSIADRSRALIKRERREPAHERSAELVELCDELLSGRGEASGVALAQEILAGYADLTTGPRIAFSTSAAILEKIIRYEAVHEIRDWAELRRRIDPPDRRCYAFFHPALVDEPLIFVEVALTRAIPGAIAPILSDKREPVEPQRATTAVFYSITNCQRGRAGVTFGHFLIKPVVEEVSREVPRVASFVTLSPAPNFANWMNRERANPDSAALDDHDREALSALDREGWWRSPEIAENLKEPFLRAAAWYYLRARNGRGLPVRHDEARSSSAQEPNAVNRIPDRGL